MDDILYPQITHLNTQLIKIIWSWYEQIQRAAQADPDATFGHAGGEPLYNLLCTAMNNVYVSLTPDLYFRETTNIQRISMSISEQEPLSDTEKERYQAFINFSKFALQQVTFIPYEALEYLIKNLNSICMQFIETRFETSLVFMLRRNCEALDQFHNFDNKRDLLLRIILDASDMIIKYPAGGDEILDRHEFICFISVAKYALSQLPDLRIAIRQIFSLGPNDDDDDNNGRGGRLTDDVNDNSILEFSDSLTI